MTSAPVRRPRIGWPMWASAVGRALEMDAEVVAIRPVAHALEFMGPQAAHDDTTSGIDEEHVAQQMGRHPPAGRKLGEFLRRLVQADLVVGVTQGLLNAGHHGAKLVGHGLHELLDMLLARLLRGLVDLVHDQRGEARDHQDDHDTGQGNQPALAAGAGRPDPRPCASEKSRGALRQSVAVGRPGHCSQGLDE
jgi:hypothetical protein